MIRILGALGIGALAMYFFDPENGRRRRAQMRDKADATYKDMRSRAQGVVAQTRGYIEKKRGSTVDIDLSQPQA